MPDACPNGQPFSGGALNVSIVTETYPPEVNGVAHTVSRLVDGLISRGHRVQVVRPRQHGREFSGFNGSVSTVLIASLPLPGYRGLRTGLPAGRRLLRAWSRFQPDVLYVATEGLLGWSAVRTAERFGVPAVSGFHTNFHSYSRHYHAGLLHRPIYRYLRALHNRTACTLVPTQALRGRLRDGAFDNVEVLGRGVDTALFRPDRRDSALRRAWGLAAEDLAVLYVGRLAAEKNLPLALAAFDAMRARQPRARLVVVGDGPLFRGLSGRRDDVVLCGVKRGEALAAHYASADVFLFPSETETFGNVTLEAMASGLAVVAFDYAAAEVHIEHGQNGLKAAPGDAEGFVRLAGQLAADPERVRQLRLAARRSAEESDWNPIIDRFEQLLARYSKEVLHGSHATQ